MNPMLAATIWDTNLGKLLSAILAAVGVIVLLIGVTKAISSFTAGTPGKGAKIIVGTAVVCAFLFRPSMVNDLINFFATVVKNVIGSANEISQNPSNYTNPNP